MICPTTSGVPSERAIKSSTSSVLPPSPAGLSRAATRAAKCRWHTPPPPQGPAADLPVISPAHAVIYKRRLLYYILIFCMHAYACTCACSHMHMHMVSTVSIRLHSIWTPPTSMDSIDMWTQYKTRAFSPLSMLLRDEHARSNHPQIPLYL